MPYNPNLRSVIGDNRNLIVLARNSRTKQILLGGLGGLGVGQMWFNEADEDYSDYPGYADAKIVND